jgi:two-component system NtrC family sensor kinase
MDDTIASLQKGEERFRSLLKLSADWYWEQDEQFRFTYLSTDLLTHAGFTSSSGLRHQRWEQPGIDLCSADWESHKADCRAHRPFHDFVYRRLREDGTARWITASGEPLFAADGTFEGYRGVGTEVTERVGREQRIVRLSDLYAALSETSRAILHLKDTEALAQEICRVAVERGRLCFAWMGLLDEQSRWVRVVAVSGPAAEHYSNIRVSADPSIPEGQGYAGAALRDGRHYVVNDFLSDPRVALWVEIARAAGVRALAVFPLHRGGKVVGVLNLHGDEVDFFTDELVSLLQEMAMNVSFALENIESEQRRVEAEAALRQRNEELGQINRRLQEAQSQLLQSEKMASIGQLAAGVAHEINNPIGYVQSNLGALDGYAREIFAYLDAYAQGESSLPPSCEAVAVLQRLHREIDLPFLREDLTQLMTESREGITRVKEIVDNLKDFSRPGDDSWQLADLHRGLDSTLKIVSNEIKYKAEVVKEYGTVSEVECLPSQLNQVFMNLLVNAAHAIEEHGRITIRTGAVGDQAWVEVADTGCGIAPENLSRLFDPFFTTKPVGKGTGLGLSLAYSIVQRHKGRFEVQSTPGAGSVFRIWLPLRRPEPDETLHRTVAPPADAV